MKKPKCLQIIDISLNLSKCYNKTNVIASALYCSAKGTKHFYETLNLLSDALPEIYKDEFEQFKTDNNF